MMIFNLCSIARFHLRTQNFRHHPLRDLHSSVSPTLGLMGMFCEFDTSDADICKECAAQMGMENVRGEEWERRRNSNLFCIERNFHLCCRDLCSQFHFFGTMCVPMYHSMQQPSLAQPARHWTKTSEIRLVTQPMKSHPLSQKYRIGLTEREHTQALELGWCVYSVLCSTCYKNRMWHKHSQYTQVRDICFT